ncbi:serine hydrolase domain-containing protein [Paracraurococcus lichenis]|uniref:Serine hydrolase domain-containing protein n=1 Tax=Paracraurococcus lichenis TaxID=3064888 RepID=A0ABT9DX53_9PROT|nr:serine hydrolase domain-containing protein [Paracraurococcus sp. LOR1-02]MDO9708479.1 serine hydrolase domain-containing protein [Paracraurococcus sp. LOR1-02]
MLPRRAALTLVAGAAATGLARPAAAQGDLQRAARPEDVGLARDRLARIPAWLQAEVEANRIPGAVVAIGRGSRLAMLEAVGFRDRDAKAPMQRDSLFQIASMTKPVTSLAAMMLVEEGRLMLWHPVSRYIPEFKETKVGTERAPLEREPTVLDLLRHTSGLTYGALPVPGGAGVHPVQEAYGTAKVNDLGQTGAEFAANIARQPLMAQPGTLWEYSHSTDVLGRVVEVASGQPLDAFFQERILGPLGMADTAFWVPPEKAARLAAAQVDPVTNRRQAMLPVTDRPKWFWGGQGLVSTAGDYVRLCQMFLNGGRLGEAQLVSRRTVALMASDHQPPGVQFGPGLLRLFGGLAPAPVTGYGFGLGFAVRTLEGRSPVPGNVGDYFWAGAFGTYFWIDPKEELYAVLMLQGPSDRVQYRYAMRQLVYGALS